MAEIAAAYPTAGSIYFWSYRLGGQRYGPFLAWMTAVSDINPQLSVIQRSHIFSSSGTSLASYAPSLQYSKTQRISSCQPFKSNIPTWNCCTKVGSNSCSRKSLPISFETGVYLHVAQSGPLLPWLSTSSRIESFDGIFGLQLWALWRYSSVIMSGSQLKWVLETEFAWLRI